ncbi:MBL fold metallo-hydrolase [Dactylosporangium roseum]|uniref:MBL fold metallo-hydrolase n=1 Tax=Dactylosporangium roseum TaxID=47989 RepID=A0ABY5ZCJ5_9ACTN|nr:MBL fold metallo-hydrolase [Dactylosporangium roseum]UWZ39379.1 MBL fold metallo-hydrolase [Dactylosporangium roseum]
MSRSGVAAPAAGSTTMQEIDDGVFAWVQAAGGWCVSNSGVLLQPDRVTLVDTVATVRRAQRLRETLARLTTAQPRLVVNTHFHGDHTFGNSVLAGPDAVVVTHELARSDIIHAGLGLTGMWPDVEWGDITLRPPDLTYRDTLTLHLGDRRVDLIHVGPAHTTGDTVVWLPRERVLFAGDVLTSGCTPFVLMGSVSGTLRAIDRLRALRPRVVVGGHGPVCGPEVLDETAGYLHWLTGIARDGIAAGLDPLAVAREIGPGPYGEWLDTERVVGNLHRAYSELRGEPEGAPLSVLAAFGEIVDYLGGRLPSCAA